eukprot:93546-Pyramimonas_sp.AAC.1
MPTERTKGQAAARAAARRNEAIDRHAKFDHKLQQGFPPNFDRRDFDARDPKHANIIITSPVWFVINQHLASFDPHINQANDLPRNKLDCDLKELAQDGSFQKHQFLGPGSRALSVIEYTLMRAVGLDTIRRGDQARPSDPGKVRYRDRFRIASPLCPINSTRYIPRLVNQETLDCTQHRKAPQGQAARILRRGIQEGGRTQGLQLDRADPALPNLMTSLSWLFVSLKTQLSP